MITAKIDYHKFAKLAWPIFILAALLLVAVFIPGVGASFGKTRSWVQVGSLFSFQPAEIMKLAFIMITAHWLADHRDDLNNWLGVIKYLAFPAVVAVLLILQPDIGTLTIFGAITLALLFVANIPWKYLLTLLALGLGGLAVAIVSAPYRARRFMTFLHPELDPQGIGYHINQALLAIGSGGIFGLGYGHSRQKYQYLPEVNADSIFAVIGEELGFIFAAAFVIFLFILLARGIKIAKIAPDAFGRYLVIGIIVWITVQSFVNIAAMVGLLPLTGVPLPFVSAGGTALVAVLAAAGMVVNVSRQTRV
ncbi:MAG: FtsW, cell division rane protein, cell division protein FtsW [Candidatus Magasanikbacteria bacterium]|nr:FtsW, cell division rane protein, cell division protein FtsW [Candidatus Magasanikbacteria bacterium]